MVYAAFIDLNRAIANQVIQHLVIMESHSVAMKISQLGILTQPTRAKKAGNPVPTDCPISHFFPILFCDVV